ncbi:MAG: pantoate--beta-alanine ligase [Gammaproteobacteria bacterium]|nr:pantoate--beta-alanine ligase [Gammaproteobacteria bacterium]
MKTVSTIADLQHEVAAARRNGKRIAFVPTMGNLHAGHIKLIDVARRNADFIAVSIYVNPLQFGPKEDFAAYPRTPAEDATLLKNSGADLLFTPTQADIYPRGMAVHTQVEVPKFSDILCGAFRPGHFRGVTTVVARLFHLVKPDVAVFGKKDYQQLLLIRLMVVDLGLAIDIIGVDTIRDADGLAMSSRNTYLRPEERRIAPRLFSILCDTRDEIVRAKEIPADAERVAAERLQRIGFRPEYVRIVRQQDLADPAEGDRKLAILAAAWLGRTRLIDNIEAEIP